MNIFLYSNLLTPELNSQLASFFECKGKSMAIIPSQTGLKTEYYFEKLKTTFSTIGITSFKLVSIDTGKAISEVTTLLEQVDIIFLSGGNTHYLREQVMRPEIAKLITTYAKAGKIIVGQSAGAIVLTPSTMTTTLLEDAPTNPSNNFEALHLIDFEFLPHFEPGNLTKKIVDYSKKTTNKIIAASETNAIGVRGKEMKFFGDPNNITIYN